MIIAVIDFPRIALNWDAMPESARQEAKCRPDFRLLPEGEKAPEQYQDFTESDCCWYAE
jgi:hypothetical protein